MKNKHAQYKKNEIRNLMCGYLLTYLLDESIPMCLSLHLFLESVGQQSSAIEIKSSFINRLHTKIMKLCIIMNIILVSEDHFSCKYIKQNVI